TINSDYKTATDFSKYRTFALMPLPQRASAEAPEVLLKLAEPAKEAVRSALIAKGLTEAPVDQADLEVNLSGQSLPRVDVTNYGFTYPALTRYGMVTVVENPSSSVTKYDERMLKIEMLDRQAKELVWIGWIKKNSSTPVRAEDLQTAIREVLDKYPPTMP